jgi:nucleoside-diphosphate-sugar epimerase
VRILFTGASSFTGYWFVRALSQAGHEVTAVFQKSPLEYEGLRKERVNRLVPYCHQEFGVSFGDDLFLELLQNPYDLVCHHAADVTNYRSPEFDPVQALVRNTHNGIEVLRQMVVSGCRRFLLTGSVFEQREGKGTEQRAISPYGLSKGMTSDYFKYYCEREGVQLSKFVIPNPFGPLEEDRFTSYLAETWLKGEVAEIKYPDYVRDNIHVSLLAEAYRFFVEQLHFHGDYAQFNPSGYKETVAEFTERFASEMRKRWKLPCETVVLEQQVFTEPLIRTNSDVVNVEWNETKAWDHLAQFYKEGAVHV